VLKNKKEYNTSTELFGKKYNAFYIPIIVNDKAIGMSFTGVPTDDLLKQRRVLLTYIGALILLLLLVVAITASTILWTIKKAYWYESILDSIPLPITVTDMDRNWTFINKPTEDFLGVTRKEILGQPCSDWNADICQTENCGINCLERGEHETFFNLQNMNFKVETEYLTDARGRKMGHIEIVENITELLKTQRESERLLKEMTKKNENEEKIIKSINEVSHTFIQSSEQIAQSATGLAKNSEEQNEKMGFLNNSMSELTERTKINTTKATEATELANQIRENATKGSEQMNKLTQAMEAINESSQSINKVVRFISDISEQTDILALNATIEAARAGEAGKGFAVVANEVSKLAAQSAESVRETYALITESIDKALLGVEIAKETSMALTGIVAEVEKNSGLSKEIVYECEAQEKSINMISNEIRKILERVQENAAAAEEFSAESEIMKEKCVTLKQLTG
jgi:methyl-accepting chemotaxis protein